MPSPDYTPFKPRTVFLFGLVVLAAVCNTIVDLALWLKALLS